MKSDWPKRNKSQYVTEIVSWFGFADVIFGGDKRQPEIRLRSQATMSATMVINRASNFWPGHKWCKEKLQILVINRVRVLGSGRRTPPSIFSGSTPSPCRGGGVQRLDKAIHQINRYPVDKY